MLSPRWPSSGVALLLTLAASQAAADEPKKQPTPPEEVSGIERKAREPGELGRDIAHAALFLPRSLVELILFTTGEVAAVVEDEQFVPRARELFTAREGAIAFFPTFFLETGVTPNVGARVIANFGNVTSSVRGGYGGLDTNVAEARVRIGTSTPLPAAISLEGLHDARTGLAFLGVGQRPFEDERNHYLGEKRAGLFRERRDRILVTFGLRTGDDTEVFVSTSLLQRRTEDPRGAVDGGIGHVFEGAAVPGAFGNLRISYTEAALRYDSRPARHAMATGQLLEVYGGLSRQLTLGDAAWARSGVRVAGFFPIYRRTNVLSPRIVLDGLTHLEGGPVPFRELVGQPSFRGPDNRRDDVSLVASIDYRWQLVRYVAARLFVDAATVGPSVRNLDFEHPRPAVGFGIDLHGSDAELGRIAFTFSPEAASFSFAFGAPAGFGDRQHRD